jgi:hypothetical protein
VIQLVHRSDPRLAALENVRRVEKPAGEGESEEREREEGSRE